MEGTYNGWTNWATWNTFVHNNPESVADINAIKERVELFESSIEDSYLKSMTYFSDINWEELYQKMKEYEIEQGTYPKED